MAAINRFNKAWIQEAVSIAPPHLAEKLIIKVQLIALCEVEWEPSTRRIFRNKNRAGCSMRELYGAPSTMNWFDIDKCGIAFDFINKTLIIMQGLNKIPNPLFC